MHQSTCYCPACCRQGSGEFEVMRFPDQEEEGAPFTEEQELELAMELLEVSSEEELDQFLGKMFKSVWKGVKKVGSVVGKIARPLGSALKAVAKTVAPLAGAALGSFIPIPGVGTALGGALGSALGKALEMELEGIGPDQREIEAARRFVRFAGDAARLAAEGAGTTAEVREALIQALQRHAPASAQQETMRPSGRWTRSGNTIVLGKW
jgi:ribosomal protein L35AE/L33A